MYLFKNWIFNTFAYGTTYTQFFTIFGFSIRIPNFLLLFFFHHHAYIHTTTFIEKYRPVVSFKFCWECISHECVEKWIYYDENIFFPKNLNSTWRRVINVIDWWMEKFGRSWYHMRHIYGTHTHTFLNKI